MNDLRRTASVTLVLGLGLVAVCPTAGAAAPDVRVLVRCQRALHDAGPTVLAGGAERLGRCLDARARCGTAAEHDPACADRVRARCERSVAAIGRDEARTVAAITRRCARVDSADLLVSGRLAGGRTVRACEAAGISAGDVVQAAHCAVWRYGCHLPTLLGAVPVDLGDLLARDARCGTADDVSPAAAAAAPGGSTEPAISRCERGTRRARARYVRLALPALGRCIERTLACELGGGAGCDPPAGSCAREHARVVRAARRLEAAVALACGGPVAEAAVAPACVVGRALRDTAPRAEELLGRTLLALDDAGCAPIVFTPPPTPASAATGGVAPARTATVAPPALPTPRPPAGPTRTRTPAGTRTATPSATATATPTPTVVVRALAVDPARPSTLYAGLDAGGVFRSDDGAASWTALVAGLTNRTVRALAIDPTRPSTLYAGTAGGVFRSSDGAASWTALNAGLTARDVHALAVDPARPATVYAGTNGGGVFRSDDGAGSWTRLGAGLTVSDVRALAVDPSRPATVYAGTNGGGVFRSDDGAGSWTRLDAGLTVPDVRALALDPSRPATVYAGTDGGGVFRSDDRGASWTPTSLATSFASGRGVRALALDPVAPATLYVGSDGGGVFKSGDGGTTWTITALAGSFAGARSVHALALDPATPAIVYAGTAAGAVFESTNAGIVWTITSAGLPAPR